jgi:hypothetical protein
MRPDEPQFGRRTLLQFPGASLTVLGAASLSFSRPHLPQPTRRVHVRGGSRDMTTDPLQRMTR